MQLICEAYQLLRSVLGLSNKEIQEVFNEWNTGDLDSYLIEITRDIFAKTEDNNPNQYIVDNILDVAGQKGTGKWTVTAALDMGMPLTMIGEAVFARCLSAQKDERVAASKILSGPTTTSGYEYKGDKRSFVNSIRDAVFASKIVSYTQGYVLMRAAAKEFKWELNYGGIALMWRGGCIIRSKFLGMIKAAFDKNPNLENLLFDGWFTQKIAACQQGWREVASVSALSGVPIPGIVSALAYYDGLRSERLPANLLQAQRDYFGAHTYERLDQPRGKFFHTNWTGRGGTTSSSTYSI
jgi:6-phosphogluconate dehydrogenase